ncbi:MAG: DUF123 domain-containing protein [Archaeoglobus sp.]|jgi:Uri superfamily endonuclease|nr:MAG: DUF123 domain-containing protein [Archaeoglobus sp.]
MVSYILVIRVREKFCTKVGALGIIEFKSGYYMYIGSAKTGISRICRHFRKKKKLRWHIDYLTTAKHAETLCAYLFENEECSLSSFMSNYSGIDGFGCSDCRCRTHLYYSKEFPVFNTEVVYPEDCNGSLSKKLFIR